ncbi:MAG: sulfite exporter TauE/SafE family protein [Bacteroidetes bacterium]|nr:sulfite exporter TauE/SafE family protein [Bacteroidota bacterium]
MHCVGMCGPLVLSMPFNLREKGGYVRLLSYHFGKIFTYMVLGLITGLIGDALRFFFVQQWISIAAGVSLLLIYFLPRMMNQWATPNVAAVWNQQVVRRMKSLLQPNAAQSTATRFFSLGMINGLLPCGLVYMALLGAISQPNIIQSVMFMAVFGLGTSPALTALIVANKWILAKWRAHFSKLAPALVVVISILLIVRGLGLGIPYISPAEKMPACHHHSVLVNQLPSVHIK